MYSEQVFLKRKNVLFKVVKTGYFYEYQLQLYIQLSEVGFKHNFSSYFSLELNGHRRITVSLSTFRIY